jgi:AbrB family looped-hinge helix DNA binding protein
MNKELWQLMNDLDDQISDLCVIKRILDSAAAGVESKKDDDVLNAIIGAQRFIDYLQDEMGANFKKIWNKTISPESKKYTTTIDEDGVLTIPDEIMEQMGWGEGTILDISVANDEMSLIIKEVDVEDDFGGGCMGDELSPEEIAILDSEGLPGLWKYHSSRVISK